MKASSTLLYAGVGAMLLTGCGGTNVFAPPILPSGPPNTTHVHKFFKYTEKPQKFVIPSGVTSLKIDAKGAGGGSSSYGQNGGGGAGGSQTRGGNGGSGGICSACYGKHDSYGGCDGYDGSRGKFGTGGFGESYCDEPGGGGGSSYAEKSATDVTYSSGVQSGNGEVVISTP
jgi:hypothetical protein